MKHGLINSFTKNEEINYQPSIISSNTENKNAAIGLWIVVSSFLSPVLKHAARSHRDIIIFLISKNLLSYKISHFNKFPESLHRAPYQT